MKIEGWTIAVIALTATSLFTSCRVPDQPSIEPASAPPELREMTYDDLTEGEQYAVNMACTLHQMHGEVTAYQSCMREQTRIATGGRKVTLNYEPRLDY